MTHKELTEQHEKLFSETNSSIEEMGILAAESERVADIAHNSEKIINDIDKQFSEITGISKSDFPFLLACVSLQCIRIFLMELLTKRRKAVRNELERNLHRFQDKVLPIFNNGTIDTSSLYYASLNQIISTKSVPYDTTEYLTYSAIDKLRNKGKFWNTDVFKMSTRNAKLFNGGNHRFTTLGHDPYLGLIFGTANILTNTVTFCKADSYVKNIQIPYLSSRHVVFTTENIDARISIPANTIIIFDNVCKRIQEEPQAVVAALIKQIIHIGTDIFTVKSLQIPLESLVLTTENVDAVTSILSAGDLLKICMSDSLSSVINFTISSLYIVINKDRDIPNDLVALKARKIIDVSNVIAESLDLAYFFSRAAIKKDVTWRNIDFGGILHLMRRINNDTDFFSQIKWNYVHSEFKKLIN